MKVGYTHVSPSSSCWNTSGIPPRVPHSLVGELEAASLECSGVGASLEGTKNEDGEGWWDGEDGEVKNWDKPSCDEEFLEKSLGSGSCIRKAEGVGESSPELSLINITDSVSLCVEVADVSVVSISASFSSSSAAAIVEHSPIERIDFLRWCLPVRLRLDWVLLCLGGSRPLLRPLVSSAKC